MSFQYPAKPWFDGQQVTVNETENSILLGTYYANKNLWAFTRTKTDGGTDPNGNIYTPSVLTVNTRPPITGRSVTPFQDPETISSQQEVNWYLYDEILKLQALIEELS